eukprot:Clim_evm18s15 gene=Clim_evmTU18s15
MALRLESSKLRNDGFEVVALGYEGTCFLIAVDQLETASHRWLLVGLPPTPRDVIKLEKSLEKEYKLERHGNTEEHKDLSWRAHRQKSVDAWDTLRDFGPAISTVLISCPEDAMRWPWYWEHILSEQFADECTVPPQIYATAACARWYTVMVRSALVAQLPQIPKIYGLSFNQIAGVGIDNDGSICAETEATVVFEALRSGSGVMRCHWLLGLNAGTGDPRALCVGGGLLVLSHCAVVDHSLSRRPATLERRTPSVVLFGVGEQVLDSNGSLPGTTTCVAEQSEDSDTVNEMSIGVELQPTMAQVVKIALDREARDLSSPFVDIDGSYRTEGLRLLAPCTLETLVTTVVKCIEGKMQCSTSTQKPTAAVILPMVGHGLLLTRAMPAILDVLMRMMPRLLTPLAKSADKGKTADTSEEAVGSASGTSLLSTHPVDVTAAANVQRPCLIILDRHPEVLLETMLAHVEDSRGHGSDGGLKPEQTMHLVQRARRSGVLQLLQDVKHIKEMLQEGRQCVVMIRRDARLPEDLADITETIEAAGEGQVTCWVLDTGDPDQRRGSSLLSDDTFSGHKRPPELWRHNLMAGEPAAELLRWALNRSSQPVEQEQQPCVVGPDEQSSAPRGGLLPLPSVPPVRTQPQSSGTHPIIPGRSLLGAAPHITPVTTLSQQEEPPRMPEPVSKRQRMSPSMTLSSTEAKPHLLPSQVVLVPMAAVKGRALSAVAKELGIEGDYEPRWQSQEGGYVAFEGALRRAAREDQDTTRLAMQTTITAGLDALDPKVEVILRDSKEATFTVHRSSQRPAQYYIRPEESPP